MHPPAGSPHGETPAGPAKVGPSDDVITLDDSPRAQSPDLNGTLPSHTLPPQDDASHSSAAWASRHDPPCGMGHAEAAPAQRASHKQGLPSDPVPGSDACGVPLQDDDPPHNGAIRTAFATQAPPCSTAHGDAVPAQHASRGQSPMSAAATGRNACVATLQPHDIPPRSMGHADAVPAQHAAHEQTPPPVQMPGSDARGVLPQPHDIPGEAGSSTANGSKEQANDGISDMGGHRDLPADSEPAKVTSEAAPRAVPTTAPLGSTPAGPDPAVAASGAASTRAPPGSSPAGPDIAGLPTEEPASARGEEPSPSTPVHAHASSMPQASRGLQSPVPEGVLPSPMQRHSPDSSRSHTGGSRSSKQSRLDQFWRPRS